MQAGPVSFLKIFDGKIQYVLPKYQRHYSWDREQCLQLWNDIINMHRRNKNSYFIGSIVNKADKTMPSGVKVQQFVIIDGQQRIATLMLLLIALRNYSRENEGVKNIKPDEIENGQIKNQYAEGQEKYKLLLTGEDKTVLLSLIDSKPIPQNTRSKLLENYNFFFEKISQNEIEPSELYEAIGRLQIVNITLDADDDAQAIFESLNSTGKDLLRSDLIRNFILMGLNHKDQTEVYERFWEPMEKLFGNDEQSKLMDDFFRDYLTMKLPRIVKEGQVYEEFKRWYYNSEFEKKILELCKDIYNFAEHYTNIIFAKSSNKTLKILYSHIKELKMTVSYPFLMRVHEDFRNGLITEENLIEIVKLCISCVVRRYICGIEANGLNKAFIYFRNGIKIDDYMNSLKASWINLERSSRFPNDEEFLTAFLSKDIFHMDKRRFYILGSLENFENKEPVNPQNFTIEHVMPQNENLSKAWRDELGANWNEIHKKYLHTIGNLTLTAYNSELGDRPFMEKMTMKQGGYIATGLRLNSFIREQKHWNEDTITERAKILAQLALKIWEYPKVSSEVLKKYQKKTKSEEVYSLETYAPSDLSRSLFEALCRRIKNLSDDITCEFTKKYAAYKFDKTNFADVIVLKTKLKIIVNLKFKEVVDLKGICRDVTNVGTWGNGDVEISLENLSELDDVMEIIEQSFNKQLD